MDYIDAVRQAQSLCEKMQDDVGIYDLGGELHVAMLDTVEIAPLETFRYVKQKMVKLELLDLD